MLLDNIKNGGEESMVNDFPAFLMQQTQSGSGGSSKGKSGRLQRQGSFNKDIRRTKSDNRRSSFTGEINGSPEGTTKGRSAPLAPSPMRKLVGALGLASPSSDSNINVRRTNSDKPLVRSPSSPSAKGLSKRPSFRADGLPPDSPILNLHNSEEAARTAQHMVEQFEEDRKEEKVRRRRWRPVYLATSSPYT